jgi:hypothetical protein
MSVQVIQTSSRDHSFVHLRSTAIKLKKVKKSIQSREKNKLFNSPLSISTTTADEQNFAKQNNNNSRNTRRNNNKKKNIKPRMLSSVTDRSIYIRHVIHPAHRQRNAPVLGPTITSQNEYLNNCSKNGLSYSRTRLDTV